MFESSDPEVVIDHAAMWVGLLGDIEPTELTDAQIVDELAAQERLTSASAAAKARLAAELHRRRVTAERSVGVPAERLARAVGHEVAMARRESPHAGREHLALALALQDMPHTYAALARGDINEQRAQIVVRESADLTPDDRSCLDATLGPQLVGMGNHDVLVAARRIAYELDVAGAEERAHRARTRRRVTLRPLGDGMSRISADLPAADAHCAMTELRQRAGVLRAAGDDRRHDQIMADELCNRLDAPALAGTRRVGVQLVMSAEMLLGRDRTTPPHLVGYGPITPGTAADLIAEAEEDVLLRRIYADPWTNTLVAMDSTDIVFTGNLRRLLHARDGDTCRTPWCDAPSRHGDHVTPRADGGTTTLDGGQGLCEACNYAKEQPGWRHRTTSTWPDQHTVEITTPTGHRHHSRAPGLPVEPSTTDTARPIVVELYTSPIDVDLELAA
ncbi:hypothetical protein FB382_001250 [Nocardioides ginsengisegetis]|uniref:HNH nuclease domain-containing protein n=1 Tax=Nocardioides ginsengisegetis TaxID=661491 RepID=A0A7W3IYQ8_9ACTN|nr:HNH endonuclease signature motif containing protein [Nocardioides ginsengisegetis]MBA8802959.1 hypothetical protein [Nocardioides ginsengisegetis]